MTTTLQSLAAEASGYMEMRKRDDGGKFWVRKDDAPDWLTELCHAAHGDMLPEDWRYAAIVHALDAFAESEDPDDVRPEPDVYTSDLLRWLASHLDRAGYCDQAAAEGLVDPAGGIIAMISAGQYMELSEVYGSVRSSLEARIAEQDDDDE